MNSKIEYREVKKTEVGTVYNCVYRFKIVSSILKIHYKKLARMSRFFNLSDKNVGYVEPSKKQEFLELLEEINRSDAKKCAESHKKALNKKVNKMNKLSFEDYCTDYLDLDISLMPEQDRKEAYQSYKSLN